MVNFKLVNKKWIDQHDTSVGQRKKNINSVKSPCSPWVLEAQWIECPPCVTEVMGSIPVGDSDFFFVSRSCHVDQFIFHKKNATTTNYEIMIADYKKVKNQLTERT